MSNKNIGQGGYGAGVGIVALALTTILIVVVTYLSSILISFFVGVVGNLVARLLPDEIDWSKMDEDPSDVWA